MKSSFDPPPRKPSSRPGARPLGYDVDDNAIRFSNYFHVLRELVHMTNGWLPLEPSFERKHALGDHVHDDARTLTKIKRRLYELRHPSDYPGSPSPELEELLDRMSAAGSAWRATAAPPTSASWRCACAPVRAPYACCRR